MASNAKFCSQCASPLPEPNPPFCSQCGARISPSSAEESPQIEIDDELDISNAVPEPEEPEPEAMDSNSTCKTCGNELDNTRRCSKCREVTPNYRDIPVDSQPSQSQQQRQNSDITANLTVPNEVPIITATPKAAILSGFKNYINFSGKASRYELFWFALVCGLILPLALNLTTDYMDFSSVTKIEPTWSLYSMFFKLLTLVYFVGVTIPLFAVFVRRLRNIEKNPKWVLFLIPYWVLALSAGLNISFLSDAGSITLPEFSWVLVLCNVLNIPFVSGQILPALHFHSQILLFLPVTYCLLSSEALIYGSVQDSIKLKLLALGVGIVTFLVMWNILDILIYSLLYFSPLDPFADTYPRLFLHIIFRQISVLGFISTWYIYKRKFC